MPNISEKFCDYVELMFIKNPLIIFVMMRARISLIKNFVNLLFSWRLSSKMHSLRHIDQSALQKKIMQYCAAHTRLLWKNFKTQESLKN